MATDKKISELTSNPTINGSEEIAEERGGSNYKNTLQDVKTFVKDGLNTSEVAETTNKKYVTDAEKVVIGNTSGTNTGDQDISGLQPILLEGAFVDGDKTNLDLNTSKVGITPTQASDITANNAKVSDINHVTIELPNVNNTSDVNKPTSTATQVQIDSLTQGQTGGLISFTTLAILQAYTDLGNNDSYKVTNDSTASNNGYYHWSGSAYVKDDSLVNGEISYKNNDSVKGGSIYEVTNNKADYLVGINLFNKEVAVPDFYVNPTTGLLTSNASYYASDWIEVNENTDYYKSDSGNSFAAYYDSDKVFISGVSSTDNSYLYQTPSTCFYFRYSTLKTHIDTSQIELGNTPTTYEPYQKLIPESQYNGQTVVRYDSFFYETVGKNIFNFNDVISGFFVDGSNGNLVSNVNASVSPKINVVGNTYFTLSGLGNVHHATGIVYYDVNDVNIGYGYIAPIDVTFGTVLTPKTVATLQFTVISTKAGDNTDIEQIQLEEGTVITDFETAEIGVDKIKEFKLKPADNYPFTKKPVLSDKRFLFFGDSITTQTGNISWVDDFQNITGSISNNYAFSGASFTNWAYDTNPRQQFSVQIDDAITANEDHDVVMVLMGTNDYNSRYTTTDTFETAMAVPYASLDLSKVMEAMRSGLYRINENFRDSFKILCLPTQRVVYAGDSSNDYGSGLREEMIKMAGKYGFTVIDSYSESGIVSDFEIDGSDGVYLGDGLHPNATGKKLLGDFYKRKVNNFIDL